MSMQQTLTEEVKQFALDQGVDLVGVASTDCLDKVFLSEPSTKGYDQNRPKDILAECKSSIVIALRWPDPLIDGMPELRSMYTRAMILFNIRLDQIALSITSFMGRKGFITIPIPASGPYDVGKLMGILSHKHAAVQAGLGEFGLSGLLLTPEFGPRQRFAQVLTSAELVPDKPLNLNLCEQAIPQCKFACIRVCPVNAVVNYYEKDPEIMKTIVWKGVPIDRARCSYYQDRELQAQTRNGYTFRCGMCIAVCPVGSRVNKRETIARGIRPIQPILRR